jgi:hypothetical protein
MKKILESKIFPWTLFVLSTIFLFQENRRLVSLIEIDKRIQKIDRDQIRDLLYDNQKLISENQTTATTNFVSGVIDYMNRKDIYNQIWHDGYNRGNQVLKDSQESSSVFTVNTSNP